MHMAGRKKKEPLREQDITSLKMFKPLWRLTALLHNDARRQNRLLHHDQLLGLLLLLFFNPVVRSLRDLETLSGLKKVQRKLGIPRFGKSTIAEALRVFDPGLLAEVVEDLAGRVPQIKSAPLDELGQVLVAVDGSLLRALPRMAWALWVDEQNRAAKLHVCFEVLKGVPALVGLTEGVASETEFLSDNLQAGRLYITDRGYAKYSLFQDIIAAKSSFVARIKKNAVIETIEKRALSEEDRRSGVVSDRIIRLGKVYLERSRKADGSQGLKDPLRMVEAEIETRSGTTCMLLATDRLDIPAHIIALIYRYRWQVELFFRPYGRPVGAAGSRAH